jgi:hypothetical protein
MEVASLGSRAKMRTKERGRSRKGLGWHMYAESLLRNQMKLLG